MSGQRNNGWWRVVSAVVNLLIIAVVLVWWLAEKDECKSRACPPGTEVVYGPDGCVCVMRPQVKP